MVEFLIITLIKIAVFLAIWLMGMAYLTWLERKLLGDFQVRLGAGYVGAAIVIASGLFIAWRERQLGLKRASEGGAGV